MNLTPDTNTAHGLKRIEEILSLFGREKRAYYSLEKIRRALAALGDPQKDIYSLLVGGTNGKGTCSLLVSAGLKEAGFHVQTYLSPHLCSPTERFLDGLQPISASELQDLLEENLELAKKFELSYFEFLTTICFVRAKRSDVDFLVLEVGLGGRLDATNLCDPLASLIATISLDHQDVLGTDKASILKEKIEIVRPEGLLFTGIQDEALIQQVEQHCLKIDAIPYYSRELKAKVLESGIWGQRVEINGFPFELSCPSEATLENAKTSLLLLRIVFPKVDIGVFRAGFRKVLLPARFECLQENPRVVLSGDHNPQAMDILLKTLSAHAGKGKVHTLAAFSADKAYDEMIPLLKAKSASFILTTLPGQENIPESYLQHGVTEGDPQDLAKQLLRQCGSEDTLLIAGSLYLAGAVRPLWSEQVRFQLSDEEVVRRYSLNQWN